MSALKTNQFEFMYKYTLYFSIVALLITMTTTRKSITCNLHFTTQLICNDGRNSSLYDYMLYVFTWSECNKHVGYFSYKKKKQIKHWKTIVMN